MSANRFDEILGQESAIDFLRRALRSGRLPHALLFSGPEGVGKRTTARALAAALLCSRVEGDACGDCPSCAKVDHRTHPDLLVVTRVDRNAKPGEAPLTDLDHSELKESEQKQLSSLVRVDQIRQLNHHVSLAPRESPNKVLIVDPADRMNHAAQNALLKSLEEPPRNAFIVLVASRPHLLLPTVRSRCLPIRFGPMAGPALAEALERREVPRDEARARAGLSGGRPGAALTLDIESAAERRSAILDALDLMASDPGKGLARLPDLVSSVSVQSEASLLEGLEVMEEVFRASARLASASPVDDLAASADAARLQRLSERLGARRCADLVRAVEKLRGETRFNINRTLLVESLLVAVGGGPLP